MGNILKKSFGKLPDGGVADLYILSNKAGYTATFSNYGATWVSWITPDKEGNFSDILLGFDDVMGYAEQKAYIGAICGRVANRIAKGKFSLNGKEYSLAINNGPNHLHGGIHGFNTYIWQAEINTDETTEPYIKFSRLSPDGEESYPGNLKISVTYTLLENGAVRIDYFAESDADTPLNLTNHSYFNLAGHNSGSILSQWLRLNSELFVPTDETAIPLGEIWHVRGLTQMDFRIFYRIGDRIHSKTARQLISAKGYDHCYIISGTPNKLRPAAELICEENGRKLSVETTEPGIQIYSGNWLTDAVGSALGKNNTIYTDYSGIALETQHIPDAINQPQFSSNILKAGIPYRSTTIYTPSILTETNL